MKICTKCNQEKNESEFQIRRASNDGLTARCKKCLSEYDKSRANNPNRVAARREYQKTEAYRLSCRAASKKYSKEHGDKRLEQTRRYREKNEKKYKCHGIVGYAMKCGYLVRENCEACGSANTHAHHDDYSKPLDVRWLCSLCHKKWHKENGEGINAE